MAYVDWLIKGPKIASCNCDYGCPCEFNGRPSRGACEGLEAQRIEQGHFGDVRLDGLVIGSRYRWPGPVHEGGGIAQGIIDERASEDQRTALLKILGGQEQEPTTVFNIYGSTIAKELDPVFAPIEFACDIPARTGRLVVPGVMEMTIEPIRNPVTGLPRTTPSSACPKASSSARPRSRAAPSAARAPSSGFATGTATPL